MAATLLGGSVMIESSHRVDTGAPDDDVVAAAPATACDDAYQISGMRRETAVSNDEGIAVSDATDTATPSGCE